jgi:hypothetical protein
MATFSYKSEYIAALMCAKLGQWARQIIRDLGQSKYIGEDPYTIQMLGDNQGALALIKNPHLHKRLKHIDIYHHYIRDLAKKGKLNITYIPTKDIAANGLTKPLERVAFKRFRQQIGMV